MLQASDIERTRELGCGREIDLLHDGKRQQSKAETRGKAEPLARERRPGVGAADMSAADRHGPPAEVYLKAPSSMTRAVDVAAASDFPSPSDSVPSRKTSSRPRWATRPKPMIGPGRAGR